MSDFFEDFELLIEDIILLAQSDLNLRIAESCLAGFGKSQIGENQFRAAFHLDAYRARLLAYLSR